MAGSRQVTRLEAENSVPDRLLCCTPSAAKPVIESKYKLRPGPADLHLLVGGWSLQGIAYICVRLENSFDPPEGQHPGRLAYTFLIRILSTSFISVSIFSVCCYSRVSISMVGGSAILRHTHRRSLVWWRSIIRAGEWGRVGVRWALSSHDKGLVTMSGRGLQGDVVYLSWPIAPLVYEPKCGGGGLRLRGLR